MASTLFKVGTIDKKIITIAGVKLPAGSEDVYQSSGLQAHIQKRHPGCVKYINDIPNIISNPDYVGINPNEPGTSIELVKIMQDNLQLGIKLDIKANRLYVATLHTITNGKLNHRINNGRLKKL